MFALMRLRQMREVNRMWQHLVDNQPAIPWDENFQMPKRGNLVFDAKTWTPMRLFDVAPTPDGESMPRIGSDRVVMSPNKRWCYDELVLPRAKPIKVCWSGGRSRVAFNGDILIPRIHEFNEDGSHKDLWMSYTPQEVITLRSGVRKAKGAVIVAGLGMGWMLTRVAHKPSVTSVLLVERDEALCDWLWPVIRDKYWLDQKVRSKMTYCHADAVEEIPKRTADVALWDIWESLGAVDKYDEADMARECKNIKTTWFWGANARIPDSLWDD